MNANSKINEMITRRMIDRINETNALPWKKPWASSAQVPKNLASKKNYRGVNVFLLHMLGYASPYFLSFKQVAELGGKVKKGEHACPVVFWKIVEPKEGEGTVDDAKPRGFAMLRYYNVFNTDQTEGLEGKVPALGMPQREHTPLEEAERLFRNMPNPPTISYGRAQASYNPLLDTVSMPRPEWFESAESFYEVLGHELAHSTGHTSRVGRKAVMEPTGFGSHAYSREELVAEMASAFLCGECGILPATETNSAAYLKGWLEKLKADPSMLIKAGGEAQKAFDYIVNAQAVAEEQELAEAA